MVIACLIQLLDDFLVPAACVSLVQSYCSTVGVRMKAGTYIESFAREHLEVAKCYRTNGEGWRICPREERGREGETKKSEGDACKVSAAGSGPASACPGVCCVLLLPNTEHGVREMFVATGDRLGMNWMYTVYSYKERLLSTPYIVLCSTGRYSISHYGLV
jgi:hypothetical protein